MKNLPILTGKSIYLTNFPSTQEFYELYKSWLNSERVRSGTGDKEEYTLQQIIELHETWKNDLLNFSFCIYDLESNEPIGDICLRYNKEEFEDGPEAAVMLGKKFGQRKGTEAMKLLLGYGFNQLNYNKINLSVYRDNSSAVNLYSKLGFKIVREQKDKNGKEEYIMILTKAEWLSKNQIPIIIKN